MAEFLIFRELTPSEEQNFREWARVNDPPVLRSWFFYHPVCRDEWQRRGIYPTLDVIEKQNPPEYQGG